MHTNKAGVYNGMANQEHLDILKQGVKMWNQWRKEHINIEPDLSGANLNEADLNNANLRGANLDGTKLVEADLSNANLSGATLSGADLSGAYLYRANLKGTFLGEANLYSAALGGANFDQAIMLGTILVDVDLSEVKRLDTVTHLGPSNIGINTVYSSHGNIPEVFLRGAGIPDTFITYIRSLVIQPFDFYSCFISYSSKDQAFVKRLHADLQSKSVRCWFAPEDMKIGDKIRPRIDEAIRIHDKLLLVLSEHSVESVWVEKEVETAFEKERLQNKLVLFPIRLDDTVMHTSQAWASDIRRTRHVGDFRDWKNHDDYQKAFNRLLRDLKAEAQKMGSRDATTNDM